MKRTLSLVLALFLVAALASAQSANSQAKSQLRVICNVSGAQVFLSGKLVGTANPELMVIVARGTYQLRVVKPGYNSFEVMVAVNAGNTVVKPQLTKAAGELDRNAPVSNLDQNAQAPAATVNQNTPAQAPAPAPARDRAPAQAPAPVIANYELAISANVNGAEVFINGNSVGRTPFRGQMPSGNYSVTVRAQGYMDANQSVSILNGPARVNVNLQSASYPLSVDANVRGAQVFVNGQQLGQTPFQTALAPGSYALVIKAPGYLDFNQSFVVGNGPSQINAVLQPQSFQVSLDANVRGAQVFVNGQQLGQTPFQTALAPGSYTLLVRAPGYLDYQAPLAVNGPQSLNVGLQPATAVWQLRVPEGLVNKDGGQQGIQVWVDGVLQAANAGSVAAAGQLTAGRHVIRLVAGGLMTETQVEIQLGKSYVFEPFLGISIK